MHMISLRNLTRRDINFLHFPIKTQAHPSSVPQIPASANPTFISNPSTLSLIPFYTQKQIPKTHTTSPQCSSFSSSNLSGPSSSWRPWRSLSIRPTAQTSPRWATASYVRRHHVGPPCIIIFRRIISRLVQSPVYNGFGLLQ